VTTSPTCLDNSLQGRWHLHDLGTNTANSEEASSRKCLGLYGACSACKNDPTVESDEARSRHGLVEYTMQASYAHFSATAMEIPVAKLTTDVRKKLPKSAFALPGGRYPVEDKAHARDAKARAAQGYNAGKLSALEKAKVDRKADSVLGKKGK
jgi:hypothetical protein